jgi:hypothetical protein
VQTTPDIIPDSIFCGHDTGTGKVYVQSQNIDGYYEGLGIGFVANSDGTNNELAEINNLGQLPIFYKGQNVKDIHIKKGYGYFLSYRKATPTEPPRWDLCNLGTEYPKVDVVAGVPTLQQFTKYERDFLFDKNKPCDLYYNDNGTERKCVPKVDS